MGEISISYKVTPFGVSHILSMFDNFSPKVSWKSLDPALDPNSQDISERIIWKKSVNQYKKKPRKTKQCKLTQHAKCLKKV